jgi:3-dehydroquinate synthase
LKKVTITSDGHRSEIIVGGKWTDTSGYTPAEGTVIITDDNINRLYGEKFARFPVLTITPGEKSKSLSTINDLAGRLLGAGAGRGSFILGIGGGVVCDIAGFLASVYMRGIKFGFVSASLLSQVDASVGGKNGVNLGTVKNIIGTFNQPEFVICDPSMLLTLPDEEYLSGLAELIKMGAILSNSLLTRIEQNKERILRRDNSLMEELIFESVSLKASIVSQDEKESGPRMILNFGHTFGHIIEAVTGQKHGLAVASGMEIAAAISVQEGLLPEAECMRLVSLLKEFGLLKDHNISSEICGKLFTGDKKRNGEDISFVLLEAAGKAVIRKIPVKKLVQYLDIFNRRK